MILTRPLGLAFLLALSLLWRAGEAAAAPAAKECDKQGAERAFLAGMRQYDKHCRDVIPRLEEAAKLCPAPEGPWSIRPNPFLEYSYLPYYFLAKCHYNLKDLPNALRHSYLASCVAEPARDKEGTEDLDSLAANCRKGLKSKQRAAAASLLQRRIHRRATAGLAGVGRENVGRPAGLGRRGRRDDPAVRQVARLLPSTLSARRSPRSISAAIREACEQLDSRNSTQLSTRGRRKSRSSASARGWRSSGPECEREAA